MSEQHTPGPWKASEPNGRGNGWRAGPAWLGYDAHSERTASDARLIAAAPELLDACRAYLADRAEAGCASDSVAVKKMRAAVAKALGSEA